MSNGLSHVRTRALPLRFALLALLALPAAAHAEDEPKPYPECARTASDSDVTAAKAAFQAGNVSFNEADYPRAILYWEDAYRRDCHKNQMLLNLARAYELNGQKKAAVNSLQTFVDREPNAPDKPQISRRIEVLQKQIDDEAAAAAPQPAPTTETPANPQPAPTAPPPQQNNQPPADAEGKRPILPLVVAGVGGVMIIGGGILYFTAAKKVKDFEDQCGNDRVCPPSVTQSEIDSANSARTRQNIGGAVAIIGVPVLAGGLIWYFMSPKEGGSAQQAAPRTAVLPAVSPGFTGLSLAGAF